MEHSRPASVHKQLQVEVEAAANVNNNNNNNNADHVPSSLVHDLSTGRQYRTSEHLYVTPPHSCNHAYSSRRTFGSFSRELSRRPLEVLKRHSVRPSLEGVAETTGGRTQEGTGFARLTNATRVGLAATHTYSPLLPLPPLPSKKRPSPRVLPADEAVPAHSAAGIHPSLAGTRYPHGNPVVPRILQKSSFAEETSVPAGPDHESAVRNTLLTHPPDPSSVSSRTVTFQAGVVGNLAEVKQSSRAAVRKKTCQDLERASHVVYVPRHNPPVSADSYTLRPFSEEDSTIAASSEMKRASKSSATSAPQPAEVPRSQESSSHQLLQPRPDSLSPDYMLVGARISGDQLVLRDGGRQVVHQLTDTESDANILAYSESHSSVAYGNSTTKLPGSESLENPGSGIRAPPSTASHGVKPGGTGTQRGAVDDRRLAEHQEESVGEGTATETEPSVVRNSRVTASGETPASSAQVLPEDSPDVPHSSSSGGCEHHSSGKTGSQGTSDGQVNADAMDELHKRN